MNAKRSFDTDRTYEPSRIKSSKNLHERQQRSLEKVHKFTKNKFSYMSFENSDYIQNSSDQIINNGDTKNVTESTLATYKDSDVKGNVQKEASDKLYLHVNGLKLVLTVLGILIPIASIIYCLYTTRSRSSASIEQAQRRLDNNLLNQPLPDFEALMLSVQNLSCAGMERFGPVGASVDIDNSRSIRRFPIQHDLIISANRQTQNLLHESKTELNSSGKPEAFQNYKRCNINTSCSPSSSCPIHICRSELHRDRYLNSSSQHNSEVKRCFVQAPPNKTVQDVPNFTSPDTQPFQTSLPSYSNIPVHRIQATTNSKVDNKGNLGLFKGLFPFLKIGSASNSHRLGSAENSKSNSNTASMPRLQSSNVSTDTFNELSISGSTNLHSKSFLNDSPGAAVKLLKPSSASSSSSLSSGSLEHNCL